MAGETKYILGFLTVLILLTGAIYLTFQSDLKIRVDQDKTTFYTFENNKWLTSGVEYNRLYNGTRLAYRKLPINITTEINTQAKTVKITRVTNYQNGAKLIDTYIFQGSVNDKELFPVSHSVEILNGNGLIYQYDVGSLVYSGVTKTGITSPQSFGRNMKVEWASGNYYSKIYKYVGVDKGKLTIKYRVNSDYVKYNLRLFDPVTNLPALISGSETKGSNFLTSNLSSNYIEIVDAYFSQSNTTSVVMDPRCGNQGCLWVPWMSSSSACGISNLKTGGPVTTSNRNFTFNVMVNDEFSQVAIFTSMANNETRMNQTYNTIKVTNTSFGQLPSWHLFLNSSRIEECYSGVNSNCDTASDASQRAIVALFNAANNTDFSLVARVQYGRLAINLTQDSYKYELTNTCYNSTLGYGPICHWLATGARAQASGLASGSYTYTGYFPDAIVAFLQACAYTGNQTYCAVAKNLSLNFQQASYPNGSNTNVFRAPPGRAFHWQNFTTGAPAPVCDQICNLGSGSGADIPEWDEADAPRAAGMGYAEYYANVTGVTLPGLPEYLAKWRTKYANGTSANTYHIQYLANGSTAVSRTPQSSIQAQAWQMFLVIGTRNATYVNATLRSAINHYQGTTKVFGSDACFGTYHPAFPVRALGIATGRDLGSFNTFASEVVSGSTSTIRITSKNPGNGSSQIQNAANLTVLLENFNVTQEANNSVDPSPKMYVNNTFDVSVEEWNLAGNYISSGDGRLNMTGNTFSPDIQSSRFITYEHRFRGDLGTSANNVKFYFQSSVNSLTGDRWFFENSTTGYNLKYDGGAFPSVGTIGRNSTYNLTIRVNDTDTSSQVNISWANSTASGKLQSSWTAFTTTGNTSRGRNGTGIEVPSTGIVPPGLLLYNYELWNIGANLSVNSSIEGNSSMNVTFYNSDTGAILTFISHVASGDQVTYHWTGLTAGLKNWFVAVRSENNQINSSIHSFTIDDGPPQVSIVYPLNTTYAANITAINYTVSSDATTCSYSTNRGASNESLTCGNNITGLNSSLGANVWSVYARDSSGNLNTSIVYFNVLIPEPPEINATLNVGINAIYFSSSATANRIEPQNQSSIKGLFRVNNNYTQDFKVAINLSVVNSKVTVKCANEYSYIAGQQLGTNLTFIIPNLSIGQTKDIWCWADYANFSGSYNPKWNVIGRFI